MGSEMCIRDSAQGKVTRDPDQLASNSKLQVLAFLPGNLDNLAPGFEHHLDQLVVRAFAGHVELLEVDLPGIEKTVAGHFFKRIYGYRVSADPALEGLHQTEGRIVSYSRIKSEMKDRVGPAIGIENLRGAPAAKKAREKKPQGKCHGSFHILLSS